MLAPATPYTIKGFLWYQGEANTGNPGEYATLMSALIGDWRNKWGQGNLPFLYVQLPNFMDAQYLPAESQWAATREAQLKALSVLNTGMAVAIDLGEWNDIHPDNKKEVGERLSLLAEKLAYGNQQVVASGPLYDTAVVDGSRIVVHFRYTGSGLTTKDGEAPGEFAIAGADKKFVWAQARLEGDKVIVWNDAIVHPLYVRYAWADNPVNPNLCNKEGLPASPFRAEGPWPGIAAAPSPDKGLKDYYAAYFPVGVAVSPRSLQSAEGGLVLQQFNSLTPENALKMGNIHPREHEYFWRDADSIVAFAQRNHLRMRGHTLCWHNQTPAWLFKDSSGNTVSKEVLLQRLKDHITTVVSRYKAKIYAWDVVNEAISDKPDEYLRPSKWLEIIGEDYIAKAFQWAHEADPNALLFYNDYNEISAVKRAKICRLVKSLQQQGVPIHAVGLQGHWAVNEPSYEQLDSTLQQFSQLGLKLQITELDISVYPKEHNARERRPEDAQNSFTPEREQQQIEKYKMVFQLFRKYQPFITGVTFWNLSERYSWLDNFPVRGRKDYPLLFDQNLLPKKAYWEVVKF
jgi:endo-1,4-beta-xylanase